MATHLPGRLCANGTRLLSRSTGLFEAGFELGNADESHSFEWQLPKLVARCVCASLARLDESSCNFPIQLPLALKDTSMSMKKRYKSSDG